MTDTPLLCPLQVTPSGYYGNIVTSGTGQSSQRRYGRDPYAYSGQRYSGGSANGHQEVTSGAVMHWGHCS